MQANSRVVRQSMRCGFLPAAHASLHAEAWQPPSAADGEPRGYDGPPATTCVGYTASLPEVSEAAVARAFWANGELANYCEGKPTQPLMDLVLELEGANARAQYWSAGKLRDDRASSDEPRSEMPAGMQVLYRREGA